MVHLAQFWVGTTLICGSIFGRRQQTVEVQRDDGASCGGMASGSGYFFFLKGDYSLADANEEFDCLVSALEDDLRRITKSI